MIIYILEGSNDEARNPQDRTMLNGVVISCNFRDKITILRTFNLTETLELIIRLCDRLIKEPSDIFHDKQINTLNNIINPLNQIDSNIETGKSKVIEVNVMSAIAEALGIESLSDIDEFEQSIRNQVGE